MKDYFPSAKKIKILTYFAGHQAQYDGEKRRCYLFLEQLLLKRLQLCVKLSPTRAGVHAEGAWNNFVYCTTKDLIFFNTREIIAQSHSCTGTRIRGRQTYCCTAIWWSDNHGRCIQFHAIWKCKWTVFNLNSWKTVVRVLNCMVNFRECSSSRVCKLIAFLNWVMEVEFGETCSLCDITHFWKLLQQSNVLGRVYSAEGEKNHRHYSISIGSQHTIPQNQLFFCLKSCAILEFDSHAQGTNSDSIIIILSKQIKLNWIWMSEFFDFEYQPSQQWALTSLSWELLKLSMSNAT